jgi:hypothetical protein
VPGVAKHKTPIRKHDARVLLSDVLPYEIPPTFSNRGLYDFVRHCHLQLGANAVSARKLDSITEARLRIILGKKVSFPAGSSAKDQLTLQADSRPPKDWTIPFQYTVKHKGNQYRTLTIPHPAAQLDIASFYAEYEHLILYHTGKSTYSLRRPARVARYSIVRDWLFASKKSAPESVENDYREYEWLRSYFTYQKYSNVYKFYDSKEYRSCERRFGYLVKADVAKCFDSIYTHSVAWAAHGHEVVKANLNVSGTFGDEFDKLMQRLNHNETSGITTGSEVSRIFAEVILQAVDIHMEHELESHGFISGTDYEIHRYVDDYFVFLADANKRPFMLEVLARNLRKYKLHLNAAKEEGEHTPWLSPLTVAKKRMVDLLRTTVHRNEPVDGQGLPRAYVQTDELIIGYKAILIDTGVSHLELANYALSRTERTIEGILRSSQDAVTTPDLPKVGDRFRHFEAATTALLGLVDFLFFVYSGAPRMSPAVKVARMTSSLLRYSRQDDFPSHSRERIEMRVRDELLQQLRRAQGTGTPDAVTATLIDCVSDLGPGYRMPQSELAQFIGFTWRNDQLVPPGHMNALLLFSILVHVGPATSHEQMRKSCEKWALSLLDRSWKDAERAIVSLDILSCRTVSTSTRSKILEAYGYQEPALVETFARTSEYANVDWNEFDLYEALQQKRVYEVY